MQRSCRSVCNSVQTKIDGCTTSEWLLSRQGVQQVYSVNNDKGTSEQGCKLKEKKYDSYFLTSRRSIGPIRCSTKSCRVLTAGCIQHGRKNLGRTFLWGWGEQGTQAETEGALISLPLLPDLLYLQSDVAIPLHLQVLWHFSHQVWCWLTLKIACNQQNVTEGQRVTLEASVREVQTSLRKCDCFPATPSVRVADTGVCIP